MQNKNNEITSPVLKIPAKSICSTTDDVTQQKPADFTRAEATEQTSPPTSSKFRRILPKKTAGLSNETSSPDEENSPAPLFPRILSTTRSLASKHSPVPVKVTRLESYDPNLVSHELNKDSHDPDMDFHDANIDSDDSDVIFHASDDVDFDSDSDKSDEKGPNFNLRSIIDQVKIRNSDLRIQLDDGVAETGIMLLDSLRGGELESKLLTIFHDYQKMKSERRLKEKQVKLRLIQKQNCRMKKKIEDLNEEINELEELLHDKGIVYEKKGIRVDYETEDHVFFR